MRWSIARRWSAADALYALVLVVFTTMAARVWWLATFVPGMDHPQFLVFVRAVQDRLDPSSPFFGTYTVGPWFMPTALPVQLTSALSHVCGHSIEVAGKVLLTATNVGLVLASAYLLRTLRRSRWAIVLVLPLIHSRWSVVGGYTPFATSLPLVVLGWALTVHWLRRLHLGFGLTLAACLCATLLWHGIGYAVLGLGFAVLWCCWRAPSLRARALSVVPTLPSLLQCAAWMSLKFEGKSAPPSAASWMTPAEAAHSFVEYVWASVPPAQTFASVFAAIIIAGLLLGATSVRLRASDRRAWRVAHPFLVVSLVYLAAYFALPMHLLHVDGVSSRFAYPAVLAFVFAWPMPQRPWARALVVSCALGFTAFVLSDLTHRFRAFDADTRGASELIDCIGLHEMLYFSPKGQGVSKDFAPGHKPMRELQQYATIRYGGLPNSSFAGYGYNYVSYVHGNPMPGFYGRPSWSRAMTKFDWVLTRAGDGPSDRRFRLFDARDGWELYGVCGSARFPRCD